MQNEYQEVGELEGDDEDYASEGSIVSKGRYRTAEGRENITIKWSRVCIRGTRQREDQKTIEIKIEHRTQGRNQISKGGSRTTKKTDRSRRKEILWSQQSGTLSQLQLKNIQKQRYTDHSDRDSWD